LDASEDVHRAGGPDLAASAGWRGAEEDAERVSRRPVAEVAWIDDLPGVLRLQIDGDGEVNL